MMTFLLSKEPAGDLEEIFKWRQLQKWRVLKILSKDLCRSSGQHRACDCAGILVCVCARLYVFLRVWTDSYNSASLELVNKEIATW